MHTEGKPSHQGRGPDEGSAPRRNTKVGTDISRETTRNRKATLERTPDLEGWSPLKKMGIKGRM